MGRQSTAKFMALSKIQIFVLMPTNLSLMELLQIKGLYYINDWLEWLRDRSGTSRSQPACEACLMGARR